jgi:hypothetical protein
MDESALLSTLKSLDTSWSVLEFWLYVCTSVVVTGVVIEVAVVMWERRHDLREFRRGTIHSPEKPPTSKYVWELLGSALVALGVLGELLVGIAAGGVEIAMRGKTGALVAIVNERAANAELAAGAANMLAQGTEVQAGNANERAGKANERARKLELEVEKLRSNNIEAADKLEQEKITRLEMEKSLTPRLLPLRTFSDGTTNIDDLKLLKGTTVQIVYVPDAEAARAAANLAYLFGAAGWKIASVSRIDKLDIEKLGSDGITLESYVAPRNPNLPSAEIVAEWRSVDTTSAVMKWLRENEWEANRGFTDHGEITPDSIRVRVGLKPYPYFEDADRKRFRDGENRTLHIDPKRYKNKTIVAESLYFGTFLKYGRISPPKK